MIRLYGLGSLGTPKSWSDESEDAEEFITRTEGSYPSVRVLVWTKDSKHRSATSYSESPAALYALIVELLRAGQHNPRRGPAESLALLNKWAKSVPLTEVPTLGPAPKRYVKPAVPCECWRPRNATFDPVVAWEATIAVSKGQ